MTTHKNSRVAIVSRMVVGERLYLETSLDSYPSDMRNWNVPTSRRPDVMKDWKFSASLFTAVGVSAAGNIRYLICVERTA